MAECVVCVNRYSHIINLTLFDTQIINNVEEVQGRKRFKSEHSAVFQANPRGLTKTAQVGLTRSPNRNKEGRAASFRSRPSLFQPRNYCCILPQQKQQAVKHVTGNIESATLSHLQAIGNYLLHTSATPLSNGPKVETVKTSPRDLFNKHLQKMRLQESVRQKQMLEKKLKYIEENIGLLSAGDIEKSSKSVKEYSWLTFEERKKWKEDWMKKAQDAEEFTKRIAAMKKEIKNWRKEREKAAEEQHKKEAEKKAKQEEAEAELKAKQKEEEERRRAEKAEKDREKRKLLAELAKNPLKKDTYLYQKMSQHYLSDVEMPELEKRKKEIAEKRNIYKPIRLLEIEEFKKKHDELMKKTEDERKKEHLKRMHEEIEYHRKVLKELKSSFTDEVIKKDNLGKEKIKEEEEFLKERFNKMKEYAKEIKEKYLPTVSEVKAAELKKQIEKLRHKPREPKPRNIETERRPAILTPAGRNSSLEPPTKPAKSVKSPRANNKKGKCSESTKSIDFSKDKKEPLLPKKINYLAELAKKRADGPKRILKGQNYQKVVDDTALSQTEKYQLIKAQTEVLERSARQKETLMTIKKDLNMNVEVGKEVSDMYINAIKAKLSLLEAQLY
eukprot:TRINITY_DN120466_c1_g1_i1.p1 TRINITY_DN120466_c1_g1~~TRINITY_DN120466_c1_g1_i1.p1  ORF type:complete len:614 (+),score=105.58 TRINITY_DN120466_c1_g1_i1:3133-4974(+)